MTNIDTLEKLRRPSFHYCAVCLQPLKWHEAKLDGREWNGVYVRVWHHGRTAAAVVPDALVEDVDRVWWFLDDDGEASETPAQRRRRELQAEVDALRARRAPGGG